MSHDHWDTNWQKNILPDVHPELLQIIQNNATGKKVLEIGFGTGGDLVELYKKKFICTGIETSKIAYNHAKKTFPNGIKVLFGDAHSLPLADKSIDVIFHQGVLEHFENPRSLMKEQKRVLTKNGIIVVDVPHKWNLFTIYKNIKEIFHVWYGDWERSYSHKELYNLAKECGFIPVAIYYRGIWPHRWGKFLFPNQIVQRKWALRAIMLPPLSWIRKCVKRLYDKFKFIQIVSSYNIILVAKKNEENSN